MPCLFFSSLQTNVIYNRAERLAPDFNLLHKINKVIETIGNVKQSNERKRVFFNILIWKSHKSLFFLLHIIYSSFHYCYPASNLSSLIRHLYFIFLACSRTFPITLTRWRISRSLRHFSEVKNSNISSKFSKIVKASWWQ